ncbi:MAG TPA: hypothetical protein VFP25_05940, partial [Nitrososphaeraceae archaeon]|nr:hypothetical protein [Nitrososphaeraceae archaeon]
SRIGSYLIDPIYEIGSITKNESLEGFEYLLSLLDCKFRWLEYISAFIFIDMENYSDRSSIWACVRHMYLTIYRLDCK